MTTKKSTTKRKTKKPVKGLKLEPIVKKSEESKTVMSFDKKATDFLEKIRIKLKLGSINEVVSTSFELLSLLDHLDSIDCQLIYKNQNNELFPISLYDNDKNKGILSNLKLQNKEDKE